MAITNISDWTKNDASLFLTFENIFFDTTNELTYKGSSAGYERIYFPIPSEPGQTVTFTVKFCSPSGFQCSYGDSKDYIALASDLPSSTQQLSSLPILAKTPLDSAASNALREYVVTAEATTTTTYCVIDFGYMLDNVTVSLKYVDISVTAEYKWKIQDGELTNTEFIPLPERPFVGDSPYTMWRIDPDINNGMPFSPLMIGLPQYTPPPMEIQPSRPLIHAYGSREQNFDGNGYAIIEPISCEIRQEENGVYEATFETYCDKYQKYTYLRKQAQVKIPMLYHGEQIQQIFRIRQAIRRMDSSGNYRITAIAQHRFYDLQRYLIRDSRPTQLKGNEALTWIFTHGWYGGIPLVSDFSYASDIQQKSTAYYENVNVVAALLGEDQAFINRWGGRLYRDNNYFSINSEMEGCRKSGVIMYSYNMTEIEFEEDDTELITVLEAADNFGNTYEVRNTHVPNNDIPHHIYGSAYFSYDIEDKAQFHRDAQAYFDEHKQSRVNITVKFANLREVKKYKQLLELDSFEVGDKITIYHKDLDIYYSNLEIISKTFDVVAQKTMEIQIGSFKNAITRRPFMSDTVSSGNSAVDKSTSALAQDIYATNTSIMAASISGMEIFAISELEKRTIAELEGE